MFYTFAVLFSRTVFYLLKTHANVAQLARAADL